MQPDWEPLEMMMLDAWMFRGRVGDIRLYKHQATRRYLNIDPDGNCYRYNGEGYEPITTSEALVHALDLKRLEAIRNGCQ